MAGQGRAGQGRAGQGRAGQGRAGLSWPGNGLRRHANAMVPLHQVNKAAPVITCRSLVRAEQALRMALELVCDGVVHVHAEDGRKPPHGRSIGCMNPNGAPTTAYLYLMVILGWHGDSATRLESRVVRLDTVGDSHVAVRVKERPWTFVETSEFLAAQQCETVSKVVLCPA